MFDYLHLANEECELFGFWKAVEIYGNAEFFKQSATEKQHAKRFRKQFSVLGY